MSRNKKVNNIIVFGAFTAAIMVASCSLEQFTGESGTSTRAAAILSEMTLEEKIGQVIQADIASITPEEARTYNIGSVLNGGNSAPGGGKTADPQAWVDLADAFWDASTDTSDGGVGVALLWGTDAVHGHNNLQTATMFPHNIGLGATQNPDLMRQIGGVTAREIRATGLDWTFAPTLAVARDDRWGRTYESYSENPALVASYSAAIIEGLQGTPGDEDFLTGENVMATAKHFIADGGTQLGIDKGDTLGNIDEIIATHGAGSGSAIAADVQSVMSSFSSVNGEKMHGSEYFLTKVLRNDMGFDGFVVGDWNGHAEVPNCTTTDCPASLYAGVDMYMAPDSWRGIYDSLLEDALTGELDLERLDEAVLRILTVKIQSGLLDAGRPSSRATTDVAILGRDDHRAVARQAVRESLVLLKNDNGLLPVTPGKTVLVTGSGADSMQQQTGGWTLNWQGTGNSNDEFINGETIFSGLQQAIENAGGEAILSSYGSSAETPDVAIVVFGEQPYAEFFGDRSDLVFEFMNGENLALIKSLKAQGIPVVSLFLTGRPLWVNPHINASDAFVVAWLPGTEGGGVADVLVADPEGQIRHDFKGKLSFSWPVDGVGEPINSADDPGVLYPYGFGLDYTEVSTSEQLPEVPGVEDTNLQFDGQIVQRGAAAGPFTMFIGDSSNANIPVAAMNAVSLGNGITISGIDYNAQEDSKLLTWSGSGAAHFSLRSARPLDLSTLGSPETLALSIFWRDTGTASADRTISLACGDGCSAELATAPFETPLAESEWSELTIPVACFIEQGLDPNSVTEALRLEQSDASELTIHSAGFIIDESPSRSC